MKQTQLQTFIDNNKIKFFHSQYGSIAFRFNDADQRIELQASKLHSGDQLNRVRGRQISAGRLATYTPITVPYSLCGNRAGLVNEYLSQNAHYLISDAVASKNAEKR